MSSFNLSGHEDIDILVGNRCYSKGDLGVVNTSGSADIATGSGTTFTIDGEFHSDTAATIDISGATFIDSEGNTTDAAGDDLAAVAVPAGENAILAVLRNADGVALIQKAAGVSGEVDFPDYPTDEYACTGYVVISNGSSSDFTPGTTATNTADVTLTFVDCAISPRSITVTDPAA